MGLCIGVCCWNTGLVSQITQTNSSPRVKKDGIGDDVIKELYAQFESAGVDDFRNMCKEAISNSSGKPETKRKFIGLLDRATNKNDMVMKITNYFLAGEGRGV